MDSGMMQDAGEGLIALLQRLDQYEAHCIRSMGQLAEPNFSKLALPIVLVDTARSITSLDDAILAYRHPRLIEDAKCNLCQQKGIQREHRIFSPPEELLIQLGRFAGGAKVSRSVSFGETINLQPIMASAIPARYKVHSLILYCRASAEGGHWIFASVPIPAASSRTLNRSSSSTSQTSLWQTSLWEME